MDGGVELHDGQGIGVVGNVLGQLCVPGCQLLAIKEPADGWLGVRLNNDLDLDRLVGSEGLEGFGYLNKYRST